MTDGCLLCPRRCGAARTLEDPGRCGSAETLQSGRFRVASLMLHHWEEPWISGTRGSGTVFFSGCGLGCCFCQNGEISHRLAGETLSPGELAGEILKLQTMGAHNINLVTPGHYADRIPQLFRILREDSRWQQNPLPVIWNSSGYETVESIDSLAGFVDIWLPDFKFADPALAAGLADAPDYFEIAGQAILAMHRLQPGLVFDQAGIMQRGLVIRHLVLPGHWRDSCRLLDYLAANLPLDVPISLMCQYTPQTGSGQPQGFPELSRRLTTYEYKKVLDHALDLGFTRILGQERSAADRVYTPDFSSLWLDSAGRGEAGR